MCKKWSCCVRRMLRQSSQPAILPTIMEIIIKIECQEYCLACQKNVSNWAKIREKPVKERRSGSHLAKLTIANKYLVKNSILSRSRTRLYLVDVSVGIVVVGVLALLTMVRLVAAACMLFICFNFKRHLAISLSVFPSFVQWWLVAAQTVSPQIHIIHYKTLKNTWIHEYSGHYNVCLAIIIFPPHFYLANSNNNVNDAVDNNNGNKSAIEWSNLHLIVQVLYRFDVVADINGNTINKR